MVVGSKVIRSFSYASPCIIHSVTGVSLITLKRGSRYVRTDGKVGEDTAQTPPTHITFQLPHHALLVLLMITRREALQSYHV
jgi:hypothetical protein